MATQKIVQVTDCHLFADPSRAVRDIVTWPRFTGVLRDIRRTTPDFDLLVFTGDTAHDEELRTYESVRRELGDWSDRVRIIPGNHDQRQVLGEVFPDSRGDLAGRVTFQVKWDSWQGIGLDSQRPGELPGSLGDEQLLWLQARLESAPRVPTLLFLHHPPIVMGSAWLDKIGLQDAAALESLLRAFPQVRLLGCGHVHQESSASFGSATVLTTPAVGPQFRPRSEQLQIDPAPPGYRMIELFSDGNWTTQTFRSSMNDG